MTKILANSYGSTALHMAALMNAVRVVPVMLEVAQKQGKLEQFLGAKNYQGLTSLEAAKLMKCVPVVAILEQAEAHVRDPRKMQLPTTISTQKNVKRRSKFSIAVAPASHNAE
eukprot:gnl/MRDRNA2_/MRDRNA2_292904_c0_seq1.p1 gnl/MRDRNA2_/MRDRNA2_292904_c0~~gnl/MRDRNA2_/MRDRNA2_292904_c0_seq1.p1  ORF type:complete len:124 (+),score=25.35 gnl/MRDRNA2_/MRDRNA2_292904_c0_seq1:36-374(+)